MTYSLCLFPKIDRLSRRPDSTGDASKFLSDLLQYTKNNTGLASPLDLAASLFCEVVPTAMHFSQALTIALEYYLRDAKTVERKEIVGLYRKRTGEASKTIYERYIREALG